MNTGWSTFPALDGIGFNMDLEDLGRIGLLLVLGGEWEGSHLLPFSFVSQMLGKQTYGLSPNYDNDNDGQTELLSTDFQESPYGLMTWVNTDLDLYPGADSTWAVALGADGQFILMDPESGIVLAMQDVLVEVVPGSPPGWPVA